MIYLLYGGDKYRLNQRLKKILGGDTNEMNVVRIANSASFGQIKNEVMAVPFLGEKKYLIFENFLKQVDKETQKALTTWLGTSDPANDLIFVETEAPDQRTTIFKFLSKFAQVETFNELKLSEVSDFIKKLAKDKSLNISNQAINLIQVYLGTDIGRINNELDKLSLYQENIDEKVVEKLVDAGYWGNIFDLTDAVSQKKANVAVYNLNKILDSGENEVYLISMIAMQIRNLLIVKDLHGHRLSEAEIVSRSKLHPFVVKKTLAQVGNFTVEELISMHNQLLRLDLEFKSASVEPRSLLEKFILNCVI